LVFFFFFSCFSFYFFCSLIFSRLFFFDYSFAGFFSCVLRSVGVFGADSTTPSPPMHRGERLMGVEGLGNIVLEAVEVDIVVRRSPFVKGSTDLARRMLCVHPLNVFWEYALRCSPHTAFCRVD
jgi:hypothetical protein